MQGSLGEKIGEGTSADVHAWAPGQVVKLYKSGVSARLSWHEAHMTHAVFASGGPAPELVGVMTNLEGRFGIVQSRLDGPTLLQLLRTGAVTRERAGAILAALGHAVHKASPPRDVPSLRELMGSLLRSSGRFPKHIAAGVLALIERLSPGDGLCHGDLHPGNVIVTAEGPRLVDWTWAVRAPAAYDMGCCHTLLSEFAPTAADDPERPRALNAAVQSEYARLAGLSSAALGAERESFLPIVAAFYLLVEATPAVLREEMMQRVEKALRPQD